MKRPARHILKQIAIQAAYLRRLREIIDSAFVAAPAGFCVRTIDVTREVAAALGRPPSPALAAEVNAIAGAVGIIRVTTHGLALFRGCKWRKMDDHEAALYARDLRTSPVPINVRMGLAPGRVWV